MGRMSAAKKGDRTYASGGHTLKQTLLIREEVLTKIKQRDKASKLSKGLERDFITPKALVREPFKLKNPDLHKIRDMRSEADNFFDFLIFFLGGVGRLRVTEYSPAEVFILSGMMSGLWVLLPLGTTLRRRSLLGTRVVARSVL